MHGAGTIDSIDKKNILDEEVEYINISMPGGVKVMVPSNQASKQGLRNIISQNDVEKVFCVLETDETAMSDNWNKRYRDNMDKMKSGDIYEVFRPCTLSRCNGFMQYRRYSFYNSKW